MNAENKNNEMLYKSNPAVAALNKVPGFDPLKLLRRTKSAETDEPVLRLDLPYKKLWFRLANPKGRIRVNALRVTEQMAIYEAQIYLNCGDTQPVGSFTAQCTKDSVPDERYIEAAQQMAINEALSDAGYGIQFADVSMRPEDQRYGSDIPVTAVQMAQGSPVVQPVAKAVPSAAAVTATEQLVQNMAKPSVPAQVLAAVQPVPSIQPAAQQPVPAKVMAEAVPATAPAASTPVKAAAQMSPAVQAAPKAAPTAPVMAQEAPRTAMPAGMQSAMPSAPAQVAETPKTPSAAEPAKAEPANTPVPAQTAQTQNAQPAAPATVPVATSVAAKASAPIPQENPSAAEASVLAGESDSPYTQESPVNEILRVMTLEQALEVVVDNGVCNGWTLREVSVKRPASLKYYIFGYKGKNNILRAAAKLVFDSLTVQTAA